MTGALDALWTSMPGWLFAASLRVAFVGVGAWAVDAMLARRVRPSLRAAVWWVVLLMAVAPALPRSPLSVWRLADPVAALETRLSFGARDSSPDDPGAGQPLLAPGAIPATDLVAGAAQASGPTRWWFVAGRLACAAWLAGAAAAGAGLLWRARGVRRAWFSGEAEPIPAWLVKTADDAARRLGLSRVPRLRLRAGVESAMVVGVWRPVVILGADLVRRGPSERVEHVVLHEFAHIRRGDPLAARLCMWATALFWFHPLIHLARARLELLRELACDELAVAALPGRAADYRLTLLDLARSMLATPQPATSIGFFQRHSMIMARLEHALRPPMRRPRAVRASAGMVFLLLAACCVPGLRESTAPPAYVPDYDALNAPGCLTRRFEVMRAIAAEAATQPPR